ncbi:hypothetical protein [Luteolibacter sp. Populi]|uniref:hypothetical protein n=1 Tax=Luteolibacter sp. Populi TaxID=3230487 RepID=UPI003465BD15
MKFLFILALVPFFASCVPNAAKSVTRDAGDDETLRSYAILRPKWPDPMDRPARFASVQTSVAQGGSQSRGVHGTALSDLGNLGLVLNPGPCSIRVHSGKPPYTSYGQLDFEARQGKIYRFVAKTDPTALGRDMTHDWEVYEEDTGKVILKREAKVTLSPTITPILF